MVIGVQCATGDELQMYSGHVLIIF
jgi:hypothetical protein